MKDMLEMTTGKEKQGIKELIILIKRLRLEQVDYRELHNMYL